MAGGAIRRTGSRDGLLYFPANPGAIGGAEDSRVSRCSSEKRFADHCFPVGG